MKNAFAYTLLSLACACGGNAPAPRTSEPQPVKTEPQPTPARHPADLIRIEAPLPHSVITSPLRVAGMARGPWFFEASFPVKLLDAQGTVVTQSPAQAKGDWMTSELVPFEGQLTFTAPASAEGMLVFEKANASGLPEHADELRVPVKFQ